MKAKAAPKAAAKAAAKAVEVEEPVVPLNPKSILTEKHTMEKQIEIDENFELVETPENMRQKNPDFTLFPHQMTVVAAILQLEDRRVLSIPTTDFNQLSGDNTAIIQTSSIVLSEPFGSGKTFEILAVICIRPSPRAFPVHVNSITISGEARKIYGRRRETVKAAFKHEITKRFTGPNALIKPNLIVVGSAVLLQWEAAIREFTTLKVLRVGNYYDAIKFHDLYKQGKLKAFDIILLKNGTVTGKFDLPGDDAAAAKEYRSLIAVISKMTENSCWSRVWYDDFDTIKIPPGSQQIDALFTGYVSATTKMPPMIKTQVVEYNTIVDLIKHRAAAPLSHILADSLLFSNFNVRNKQDFVEQSTKIPIVKKWIYVYDNPDDNYIRLMGAMGEADANNIMEALNGDAVGEAAAMLGIKSTSVADIFAKMLDKKYEVFIDAGEKLDVAVDFHDNVIPQLEPKVDEEGRVKKHTAGQLDNIRQQVAKKVVPKPDFGSDPLEQLSDEMVEEYRQLKDQNGLAINRVIDNLKEGSCQVCALPLESMDTFIVKCCGLIVCDLCGVKGNQIGLRYDYKTKSQQICGACANCKATIYPSQGDLIFVDRNFDMQALLTAKGNEKPADPLPEPVVETVAEEVKEKVPEIKNPKIKALLTIVRGGVPENRSSVNSKIKHLLEGRADIPADPKVVKKVVVFANFKETLDLCEASFVEHKVNFLRLGGTFKEMMQTVKDFDAFPTACVLLINSQQHCAGLNIQKKSTDLCYFHKILDENIESQVAGRVQRIGRTFNVNFHYLCYKNEKSLV